MVSSIVYVENKQLQTLSGKQWSNVLSLSALCVYAHIWDRHSVQISHLMFATTSLQYFSFFCVHYNLFFFSEQCEAAYIWRFHFLQLLPSSISVVQFSILFDHGFLPQRLGITLLCNKSISATTKCMQKTVPKYVIQYSWNETQHRNFKYNTS